MISVVPSKTHMHNRHVHNLTVEMDTRSLPLRYLLLQNHINVCPGEQQRGHGGVQLIFRISASRSTIAQAD